MLLASAITQHQSMATDHLPRFKRKIATVSLLHPLLQMKYKIHQTNSESGQRSTGMAHTIGTTNYMRSSARQAKEGS